MTHNGVPTIWFGLVIMALIYAPAIGLFVFACRAKGD